MPEGTHRQCCAFIKKLRLFIIANDFLDWRCRGWLRSRTRSDQDSRKRREEEGEAAVSGAGEG